MGYMEICMKVKNAGWIEVDDPEGPYAFSKDKSIWVGYDNPGSAADKANYVLARGLGGVMLWDLPQDDFSVRSAHAFRDRACPCTRALHFPS